MASLHELSRHLFTQLQKYGNDCEHNNFIQSALLTQSEAMQKWTDAVSKKLPTVCIAKTTVNPETMTRSELFDPKRYLFWKALKVRNAEIGEKLNPSRGVSAPKYPAIQYRNARDMFDFLNFEPDVMNPGVLRCPEQVDDFGSFEGRYVSAFAGLIMNGIIKRFNDGRNIDLTFIVQGLSNECRRADGSLHIVKGRVQDPVEEPESIEDINRVVDLTVTEPNDAAPLKYAEEYTFDASQSKKTPDELLTMDRTEALKLTESAEDEPRNRYFKFLDTETNGYNENKLEHPETDDWMESATKRRQIVTDQKIDSDTLQYVDENTSEGYFSKAVQSNAFQAAIKKSVPSTRIRRICIFVPVRAHVLKVVLDTYDSQKRHTIFVCNNGAYDKYPFHEYYAGHLNNSILRAFYKVLTDQKVLIGEIELYNDTAYRSIMRSIFLLEEEHGSDMACGHYQLFSTLYLSMVKDPINDKSSALCFANWAAKRYIRFHFRCFHLHLRRLAHKRIMDMGQILLLPKCMEEDFVNANDIRLISYNTITRETYEFEYQDHKKGFVQLGITGAVKQKQRPIR